MTGTLFTISDMAEDIIDNGVLSKGDVQEIAKFIEDLIDVDTLIELLDITNNLSPDKIDDDMVDLLVAYIKKLFYYEGTITDRDAIELIALFDPEEALNPFERKVFRKIKTEGYYGKVLRDFMDDHNI